MKARMQNIGLFLASLLFCLIIIEVALRIWGPEALVIGNQYVFYKFDPVLGWTNIPNSQGRFSRIEFSHPIQINSQGMRDKEVQPKNDGELRIAILGDSFTWGVGAAYGERFTEILESLNPKINALNFGVSGFSPIQYLFQLDSVLALQPDYVIVVFCLGNDLTDNVEYNPYNHAKPYGKIASDRNTLEVAGYPLPEDKEIGIDLFGASSFSRIIGLLNLARNHIKRKRTEEAATGKEIVRVADNQLLYVPAAKLGYQDQEKLQFIYKVNELILDAIRRRVDAALGPHRFAVLLAPSKFEYGMGLRSADANPSMVADNVITSLKRLFIPVIDGRTVIQQTDFWKIDGHWRPSGHRRIGELLNTYFNSVISQSALQ